jgi:cyclic pyranopterin phosphate synthase
MTSKTKSKARFFSHLDLEGKAQMVDVSGKPPTQRTAEAIARVQMNSKVLGLLRSGSIPKGDVWAASRIAGILAAKKTHELIPLCHPLKLEDVKISFAWVREGVEIFSFVKCEGKTGAEMEALTAVTVAALTLYDMCKAVDKGIVIGPIYLKQKTGGKSGIYVRQEWQ